MSKPTAGVFSWISASIHPDQTKPLHPALTQQLRHELLRAGNVLFKALNEQHPAIERDELADALRIIARIGLIAVKRNRIKGVTTS